MTPPTPSDAALDRARTHVTASLSGQAPRPIVHGFFDEPTHTATFVVHDPESREAAVIDSVLGFDPAAGTLSYTAADQVIDYVRAENLTVAWILETHVHADHLSAAPYLQGKLGGRLAIGRGIVEVQETFGKLFNAGTAFASAGTEFDRLFEDGDRFALGGIKASVLHVPGHTPADLAYIIGDAAFVGDTLFMPDYGTARADFPGGDARLLFRSIRRLLALPDATRLFLCHDYKAPGRDSFVTETTVAAQRRDNVHVRDGTAEDDFVAMREARDRTLAAPRLIMPSIQVNMRGGRLPEPEANGTRYLKIPLTTGRG
ncbi:MBL fold metallo-hydrolase [Methylobacterium sp. Leaf456]|uniref:MBL fold metallo-hydrolase n=1 Tax=Methylobacterium sp. Leaf456 TaxID=1736382 RepID=UPI0006FF8B05|nr:MBL fold metallo-hydrolase [Methylobacterium sp. Leaf456]KQT58046.1 MBL fold metallo-hydrolase [Methylobacterium sp. Leaf456]